MQTAIVEILLNGNIQHTTTRRVTPAEIVMLRHIHGSDSVVAPVDVESIKRSNADEVSRLKSVYGDDVFKQVFPGAMPKVPSDLSEVNVEIEAKAKDEPKA
ncbi:hypothetical protein UFOVP807_12 [uncultured Caudovirales phage]|jgi:hypothetical protein|uniref:Uncharacterized protein n=1 Tax=uncultured Caudovirales phage TaxID=2100421 RepID=A0A6J5LZA0_9CAUD|nr:hypothetical protein UFOVP339_29 [uncultured Caudovirales phage]CAB4163387.1 hypothetical protein UFOVP807_12 [uncultured Caudovirales phage]